MSSPSPFNCPWVKGTAVRTWRCPLCGAKAVDYDKPPSRNCDRGEYPHEKPQIGVGSELKKLLRKFRITSKESCKCKKHTNEMNRRGPDWCVENIDTIVGWLRAEAKKRKLPFSAVAVRILIRKAIRNARKKVKIEKTGE